MAATKHYDRFSGKDERSACEEAAADIQIEQRGLKGAIWGQPPHLRAARSFLCHRNRRKRLNKKRMFVRQLNPMICDAALIALRLRGNIEIVQNLKMIG